MLIHKLAGAADDVDRLLSDSKICILAELVEDRDELFFSPISRTIFK